MINLVKKRIDDHIKLKNIGSNTHVQIDTHIADNSIHQTKYTDAEAKAAAEFHDGGESEGSNRTLGNTDNYSLGLKTNNTTRLNIASGGSIGLGTPTNDNINLKIAGGLSVGVIGSASTISGYVGSSYNDWYALAPNLYLIPSVGWKYLDNGFGGIIQFARYPAGEPSPYWAFLTVPLNSSGADAAASGFVTSLKIYGDGRVMFGSLIPTAIVDVNSDIIRLRTAKTPASASAAGNQGDICWDSNYIYVCVATNTWKRSTISVW